MEQKLIGFYILGFGYPLPSLFIKGFMALDIINFADMVKRKKNEVLSDVRKVSSL